MLVEEKTALKSFSTAPSWSGSASPHCIRFRVSNRPDQDTERKKYCKQTERFAKIAPGPENPIWPPEPWYSHTNFFSMGDNSKIIFPTIGFSYPGSPKK